MKTLTNFIKESLDEGTSELIYHVTRIWEDIDNNSFALKTRLLRRDINHWISELEEAWGDDKYAILGDDEPTDPEYKKEFGKFKAVEKKIDKAVENAVKIFKEFDKKVAKSDEEGGDDDLREEYYDKIEEAFDDIMVYENDLYYWYRQLDELKY